MAITLSANLINILRSHNISTLHQPGFILPDDTVFEPPCSFKWMGIYHSLLLGSFSYAVNGYYFACEIGRYCSIGEQVQIGRHPHPMHWVSTSPFFYSNPSSVMDHGLPANLNYDPNIFLSEVRSQS